IGNARVSATAGQTVNKALFGSARARVTGTVVEEDKGGIAGARLASRNAGRDGGPMIFAPGRPQDATGFSGPDGRFVLSNVLPEAEVQIEAAKKGFPATHSAAMRLNPGEKKSGVMITIPRGVLFTGKVVDAKGRTVSGVGIAPVETEGRGFGPVVRRIAIAMQRDREEDVVRSGSAGTFRLRVKEGTLDVVFKRDV